jgi:hypothetical protein
VRRDFSASERDVVVEWSMVPFLLFPGFMMCRAASLAAFFSDGFS